MENDLTLAEAAAILNIDQATLKKRCQRGAIPGAYKIGEGKEIRWMIPASHFQQMVDDTGASQYQDLHAEWVRRMERGLGHKKPVSPRGIEAFSYGLSKFWLFLEKPPTVIKKGYKKGEPRPVSARKPNLSDVTLKNLEISLSNFPIDRVNGNCHFSMRLQLYSGFCSFFKFLVSMGLRSKADFADLGDCRPLKIYEENRPVLTKDQLEKLIEINSGRLTGRSKQHADQDIYLTKVIIYLSAVAGLRREEMIDLKLADINLKERIIHVIDGKGNKNREVGFGEDMRNLLYTWVSKYRPVTRHKNLLITKTGLPIGPKSLYDRIRRMGEAANLKTVSPHALRRTFANVALDEGIALHVVSDTMGHSKISTTEKSYIRSNRRKSIQAFKGFDPLK